jgi:hypothetical protein
LFLHLVGLQLALAQETELPPANRLWYTNATYLRVNPLGLVDMYRIGWRRRLTQKQGLLWDDTYTLLGAGTTLTPAWARVGLYAEAQPIALLRVFADIGFVGYFGNFDQVLSWSDPAARFSDQTLSSLGEAGAHRATTGSTVTLGGALRAKAGPIAIRDTAQLTRLDLDLPSGEAWFYDQLSDRLVPDGGFVVLNDLDLLVVTGGLRAGARHTFTDNLSGDPEGTDGALAQHRLGPLVALQLADKDPGAVFNQPTLFLLVQWWLVHPYRTGQEQPAALPLVAAGFSFNGDLSVEAAGQEGREQGQ